MIIRFNELDFDLFVAHPPLKSWIKDFADESSIKLERVVFIKRQLGSLS